jgi:hypothetical protein
VASLDEPRIDVVAALTEKDWMCHSVLAGKEQLSGTCANVLAAPISVEPLSLEGRTIVVGFVSDGVTGVQFRAGQDLLPASVGENAFAVAPPDGQDFRALTSVVLIWKSEEVTERPLLTHEPS